MLNYSSGKIRLTVSEPAFFRTLERHGGELRIQAVFPDGATVVINRFGEYQEQPYVVHAMAVSGAVFRLWARPLHHHGVPFSTKPLRVSGLTKAMRALHLPETQIAGIKASLQSSASQIEIGGSGPSIQRVFGIPDLIAAGFEEINP